MDRRSKHQTSGPAEADPRVRVVSSRAIDDRLGAAADFIDALGPAAEVLVVGATRKRPTISRARSASVAAPRSGSIA
jgi:hypothetical protein